MTLKQRILIFLLLILAIPTHSEWIKYRELHIWGKSVVRLLGSGGGGTGFQVMMNGKQYTLTNDHVCALAQHGFLIGDSQYVAIQGLKVLLHSPDTDLCLLAPMKGLPALELGNRDFGKGERLTILGHPALRPLEASHGRAALTTFMDVMIGIITSSQEARQCTLPKNRIVDLLFGLIYACVIHVEGQDTSAKIEPGSSGSPVVDSRGDVRGVAFASDNATHRGAIIPFHSIRQFAEYCKAKLK